MKASVSHLLGHTIRPASARDHAAILALAEAANWPNWLQADLPRLVQSRHTLCWVLPKDRDIVGFALAGTRGRRRAKPGPSGPLNRVWRFLTQRRPDCVLVDVFGIAMAPAFHSVIAEHWLLDRLHKALSRCAWYLRIVVPETDLAAQKFLHEAGYHAVRVLHQYYGDQDGYLMVHPVDATMVADPGHEPQEHLGACST